MSCYCLSMVLFAVGFCFSVSGIAVLYFQAQDDQISDVWLLLIILLGLGTTLMLVGSLSGTCSVWVTSCGRNKVDSEGVTQVVKDAWEKVS